MRIAKLRVGIRVPPDFFMEDLVGTNRVESVSRAS